MRCLKVTQYSRITVILLMSIHHSFCHSSSIYKNAREIKNKLLSIYNLDAVPTKSNGSLTVEVTLYVMALQNVDEKSQVLTTSVFWMINWKDYIFMWNRTQYGLDRMTIKVKDLWVPDVFVVNSVNDMRISEFKDGEYVNVFADGNMTWFPSSELMTSCFVDVSRFPFDVQTCSIRIESWYHDGRDFVLKPSVPGIEISTSHFFENGEWEIINLSSEQYRYENYVDPSIFYTGIEYKIGLKRRSSYHLLTTLFPFLILIFLNTISTIIPTECGEKLGFCMSQFLTMIVFLTLVAQSMPASSLTISYFALIVGSQILVSGFSAFIVAATIFVQSKLDNSRPPALLSVILVPFVYFCVHHNKEQQNDANTERITWKLLNAKLNNILKVTLYINVVVCLCIVFVLVWIPI